MNDAIKPLPKRSGLNSGTGNDLIDNEVVENFGNLQAPNRYTLDFGHPAASTVTSRSVRPHGRKKVVPETGPSVYRMWGGAMRINAHAVAGFHGQRRDAERDFNLGR
jgi:hypothetical protein